MKTIGKSLTYIHIFAIYKEHSQKPCPESGLQLAQNPARTKTHFSTRRMPISPIMA